MISRLLSDKVQATYTLKSHAKQQLPANVCIYNKHGDAVISYLVHDITFTAPYLNDVESVIVSKTLAPLHALCIDGNNIPLKDSRDMSCDDVALYKVMNTIDVYEPRNEDAITYKVYKDNVKQGAFTLTLFGSLASFVFIDKEAATAFMFGGLLNLAYLQLLYMETDNIGTPNIYITSPVRIFVIAVAAAIACKNIDPSLFLLALFGFLTGKASLIMHSDKDLQ